MSNKVTFVVEYRHGAKDDGFWRHWSTIDEPAGGQVRAKQSAKNCFAVGKDISTNLEVRVREVRTTEKTLFTLSQ